MTAKASTPWESWPDDSLRSQAGQGATALQGMQIAFSTLEIACQANRALAIPSAAFL
ncbi:MAG TPA: hypothetical protein PKV33_00365 [Methanothrix sp.]|nr:hypothetical protein [Methanothrix sp.]